MVKVLEGTREKSLGTEREVLFVPIYEMLESRALLTAQNITRLTLLEQNMYWTPH